MHTVVPSKKMCAQLPALTKLSVILVWCVLVTSAQPNNVCSRVNDYDIKSFSDKCFYNSDVVLSVPDVILKYGYPLEIYDVITQDGYILKLFRIPHGKNSTRPENKILQPVLLQHGIAASSAPYVINGNESIGFLLADEGYDVWLANSRGSEYGKGHVKLSTSDVRFWNFSYHEMAVYDVPKTLDLIYKVTKRKDIIFIAQSMGTNIQLAYASELPLHAKKRIKFMVYLAPSIFPQYFKSPIVKFFPLWPKVYRYLRKIGVGELLSKTQVPTDLLLALCTDKSVQILTCELSIFALFGIDFDNLPPEIVPVIMGHYPGGTSLKVMDHLIQNTLDGKFAKYDYGSTFNLKYYGSTKPPEYQLSRVNLPGLIMYGANDFIAPKENAVRLFNALPKVNTIQEIKDKKYNHIDFFFARNVVEQIINPVLKVINNYKVTIKIVNK